MRKKKRKRRNPQGLSKSQIKLEVLKGRAEWLEKELQAVKKRIKGLKRGKPKAKPRAVKGKKKPTIRELAIQVLRDRRNRPTHLKKMAEILQKKGFRVDYRSMDSVLRRHPNIFEKVEKATFRLKRKK